MSEPEWPAWARRPDDDARAAEHEVDEPRTDTEADGLPAATWWISDERTRAHAAGTASGSPQGRRIVLAPRIDREAWLALLFGILGIVCCGLVFAPPAIIFGNRARRRIRRNRRLLKGDDLALAGVILGWVAVAELAIVLLLVVR